MISIVLLIVFVLIIILFLIYGPKFFPISEAYHDKVAKVSIYPQCDYSGNPITLGNGTYYPHQM
jgi:hypothetical protein